MTHSIRIDRDIEMTTRDGVILRAHVVRPDVRRPVPAILCRTPYGKDLRIAGFAHLPVLDAAGAGFAVVFQDIRGRFSSEGDWVLMGWDGVERSDGYDSIEWVAGEPWCDGRVGMMGASYEALNALAAAQAKPANLRAIAPAMIGSANARMTTRMLEGIVLGWSALIAVDVVARRRAEGGSDPADMERDLAKVMAALTDPASVAETLPLDDLAPLTIPGMPTYRQLTDRIMAASGSVTAAMDRVEVPALWTTGWWDQAGGSELFRALRQRGGSARAREESRLIIGPWSHTQHDVHLGELGFGHAGSLVGGGVGAAHLAFFSRHLRDDDTTSLPVVRYFLTGENAWRYATEWPPPGVSGLRLYLRAAGGANSANGDGALSTVQPARDGEADVYRYDPAVPVPSVGVRALNLGGRTVPGPFDQARVERRKDVLVYTTKALESTLEVTGEPKVQLFISTTAPDTDFVVKLCDVDVDATSRNIADGMIGLRWSEGPEPRFANSDEVISLTIYLGLVGHAFRRGHRLRLQVTSSAFPHLSRNLNTDSPEGTETKCVVAEQTVHRSREFPSCLDIPVMRTSSRSARVAARFS